MVYAAEDKKTHQRYAVKCIKKRDLQKSDVQSLKNEVYIMGQVGLIAPLHSSSTTPTSCGWRASTTTRTTTTSSRNSWTVGEGEGADGQEGSSSTRSWRRSSTTRTRRGPWCGRSWRPWATATRRTLRTAI